MGETTKPALGSTRDSIDFLKRWSPEGPWVLTSIIPDGRTETVTFQAGAWAAAATWIDGKQGVQNVYFHVNPVRQNLTSKASKEDMARMGWLHVDIDPRAGEDFGDERTRALGLLRGYSQPPTVIIDSGGGYQAFWKLKSSPKLEINGDIGRAQELEAYNQQLEKVFGADHCHNVDRIMRLPGTINVPNAKKLKKGRKPALAALIEWKDVEYAIEDFTPAVRVQTARDGGLTGGRPKLVITGNVADVSVEDLQAWAEKESKTISEHTLAMISTGQHPTDSAKYASRSEALFKVCCDLVRAGVPDEMIFGVISGGNEIAASVRDKPSAESYALRQIERAHEEAIDPWLRRMNEKHAVISDLGGKCVVISETFDFALGRTRISRQLFGDIRNRYSNERVVVGTKENGEEITKQVGNWWLDNRARRQYDCLCFVPGKEVPPQYYNMWKGFACDRIPGRRHESFLAHVKDNVCSGNEEHYTYLLGWMARLFQQPDCPGEVATVIRGARGTGKGFFIKALGHLFGRHFLPVSDPKHLVGAFNAHLRDTVLLFGDEAFFAGDKKHESVLKTLVTEDQLIVEGKGVDAEAAPNYVHLFLASNEQWVVPAGVDERRFFVLTMSEARAQDHGYFKGLKSDLEGGGYENLLDFLLTYDISKFEVRRVPQTAALQDQKVQSMSPEDKWMLNKLAEGRILKHHQEWEHKVVKDALIANYVKEMTDSGRHYQRLQPGTMGAYLKRVAPEGTVVARQSMMEVEVQSDTGMVLKVRKRVPVFILPALSVMRDYWDNHMGGPYEWEPEGVQVELETPAPRPF